MKHSAFLHPAVTILLTLVLLISSCKSQRQLTGLGYDTETASLIRVGKKYLNDKQYDQAADVLDDAASRPFNQSTTAAVYLSGLANFYAGDYLKALQRFNRIEQTFPRSKYVEEARFHRALILLNDNRADKQMEALNLLARLSRYAENLDVAENARNAYRKFLFYESNVELNQRFFEQAEDSVRQDALEALCYIYQVKGQKEEATRLYQSFLADGGTPTPFLQSLMESGYIPEDKHADVIRIGLILPLYADNPMISYLDEIPKESKPWLDFYEGFLQAVQKFELVPEKKVFLKILDSQSDTLLTPFLLEDISRIQPQVIIGGVDPVISRQISDWAEINRIPYLDPFSYESATVESKAYTFLLNPSIKVHGANMANFAFENLGMQKVAIWSNRKAVTETMIQGFQSAFDTLGGETFVIYIDSVFDKDEAIIEIPKMVNYMKTQEFDGVYIPINRDEVSANLILSIMKREEVETQVLGAPRWKTYRHINRELKEDYQLHFTTSNIFEEEDPEYQSFYTEYLKNYAYPPNARNLQGYDIANYSLNLLGDYGYTLPLTDHIKQYPKFRGVQLSYFFDQQQVNQFVNIAKYYDGGIVKVKKPEGNLDVFDFPVRKQK